MAIPSPGEQTSSGSVYYFNSPESVKSPGTLGEAYLPSGKPARLFFHFVNRTNHVQPFKVVAEGAWCAGRNGFGLSPDPGKAGTKAAIQFLSNNVSAPPTLNVSPGETVSGIIDCHPIADTRVVCSMGTGPTKWKVEVANSILEIRDVDMKPGKTSVLIGSDDPGTVKGGYGTTVRLRFHNKTAKKMHVTMMVSPRGGALPFVYLVNKSVSMTDSIPARATKHLFTTEVLPGQVLVMDTIPTGGYSYPVKVTASVLQ